MNNKLEEEMDQILGRILPKLKDDPICDKKCDSNKSYIEHKPDCAYLIHEKVEKLKGNGLSKRDIEILINGLNRTKAFEIIQEYEKNGIKNGDSLVMSGGTGVGKTIAASSLFLNYSGMRVYSADLQEKFLNTEESHKLNTVSLLVVDDLGLEYKKDFFNSRFDSLINSRHGAMLPTVITTNLNAADFKIQYSERIISRLKDWGKFVQILDKDCRGKC